MTSRSTAVLIDEFISRSQTSHGDFYDYSQIEYINTHKNVKNIICPKHGAFDQNGQIHMAGSGCNSCGIERAVGIWRDKYYKEFIERATKIHGDTYDYSKVVYVKNTQKVIITCKIHGDFGMTPSAHIRDSGCKKCSLVQRHNNAIIPQEVFIERCKNGPLGDTLDYSKVIYTGSKYHVIVTCIRHNIEFSQIACGIIKGDFGCKECLQESRVKTRTEKLNQYIESFWTGVFNGKPVHVRKDGYIDGRMLLQSQGREIFMYTNTHYKTNIIPQLEEKMGIKRLLDVLPDAGIKTSWIHPYYAWHVSHIVRGIPEFPGELIAWFVEISKTCLMMSTFLQDAREKDLELHNALLATDFDTVRIREEEGEEFEAVSPEKYKLELNNMVINARMEDGYINATQLCKAGGKLFGHWYRLSHVTELINALKESLIDERYPHVDNERGSLSHALIDVIQGGRAELQGSWIHPDLAVHLAIWLSPKFGIQVSKWIRELLTAGEVSVKSRKTDEELNKLRLEFTRKNELLKESTDKIKTLEMQVKKRIARNKYQLGQYIYIVHCKDTVELTRRYKIGKTENLEATLASYNRLCPSEYIFYQDCKKAVVMDAVELFVHSVLDGCREASNHEYFTLPPNQTTDYFINTVRRAINAANDSQEYGVICQV